MQPTLPELRAAMQIAIAIDTKCAYRDLQRIRERKTTWVGCEENDLRFEIDRVIMARMRLRKD